MAALAGSAKLPAPGPGHDHLLWLSTTASTWLENRPVYQRHADGHPAPEQLMASIDRRR